MIVSICAPVPPPPLRLPPRGLPVRDFSSSMTALALRRRLSSSTSGCTFSSFFASASISASRASRTLLSLLLSFLMLLHLLQYKRVVVAHVVRLAARRVDGRVEPARVGAEREHRAPRLGPIAEVLTDAELQRVVELAGRLGH